MSMTQDIIGLHDGRPLLVHLPDRCAGRACCIHNPSEHPLSTAPLNWRSDRYLMERVCEHGVGHPDPDNLTFKRSLAAEKRAAAELAGDMFGMTVSMMFGMTVSMVVDPGVVDGIHGCDGCCRAVAT